MTSTQDIEMRGGFPAFYFKTVQDKRRLLYQNNTFKEKVQ